MSSSAHSARSPNYAASRTGSCGTQLVTANGVADVASVGGFERQCQVVVDPRKLQAYGISLDRVSDAIRDSNRDVGGRTIEMSETE